VKLYLAGKGKNNGRANTRKKPAPRRVEDRHFDAAHLVFEIGQMKILKDGRGEIAIFIPHDHLAEALELRTSYGMLLEGTVTPVKRKQP
jgi:hypothetical protein